MIQINNVSLAFGNKKVLSDFSLSINDDEITCILGPSGCGKTTLLRIAAGLIKPDSGAVIRPVMRESYLFQENRLLPWFNARENITALGVPLTEAMRCLDEIGLSAERESLPSELSGGMARRLAIARMLAYGGKRYFIDEPLQGLDAAASAEICRLLRSNLSGSTALIITHSAEAALVIADRILYISGTPVELKADFRADDPDAETRLSKLVLTADEEDNRN